MSWTARITHSATGELRLQFSEPLSRIDMTPETARRLAALILVAAEERITSNDVEPKTAMNGSRRTTRKPKTSKTVLKSEAADG
ncbi:MAG TPA: hypothetical protein VGM44_01595 [Polyangiaceae bacterium]|jgi:hypothetical protein